MPDLIRFSDIKDDHPLTLDGSNTLIAIAQPNQSSETGYSSMTTTPNQLSAFAVESATFANLETSNKTVESAINQTILNLANKYDATQTYDEGDCVLYNGNLYQCNMDITVAEAWDSTHWDAIKAVDVGAGGGGASSADQVSFDDTDVAFEADDVQEAFENITKSLTWAEYQQLTSEEKNNGTIYLITDVNGDGQSFQPVCYSETEREIGVWTDGKPVYQKTIDFGALPSTGEKSVAHGISNLERVVSCISITKNASGTTLQLPYVNSGNTDRAGTYVTSTDVVIPVSSNLSSYTDTWVTLQYTKTTDTAGSGTWTPQGVPAVHYSTDEQVIGTWVDGSTLYERTLHSTATPTGGAWNSVPIGNVNVLSYEAYFIRTTGAVDALYESFDSGLIGHIRPDTTGVKFEYKVPSAYVTNFQEVDVTIRYTKSST